MANTDNTQTSSILAQQQPGGIRNISQTVQEREIIKTAPDIVVFVDGLPYLTNVFVNDPRTNAAQTLVNFNDHVVSFSATYDTDSMVPNCTIGLQVPNYLKYLYQMPGGNNLLQTMAQVQVYAKSYFMAATGDTVYRRVFKGVSSYIGYNDNSKTLEISIQCHGTLHLLEKMQININPSAQTAHNNAERQTIFQSYLASGDCFQVIASMFTEGLRSDGFQSASLKSGGLIPGDPFYDAVKRGYMAKWQSILINMVKDVHIYGPHKDTIGDVTLLQRDGLWGTPDKMTLAAAGKKRTTQDEKTLVANYNQYYDNITKYLPFRNITALRLTENVIVNRLDAIREVVRKMDFEAYQDIDGKIIVKPPLYNLDVVNLGTRTQMTSTQLNSSRNSRTNPATAIYPANNPFVVHLSEILTEQENEDQSAIRRTRTTVAGNAMRQLGISYPDNLKAVGEYIDISKLAKFGLREEPLYQVPWLREDDKVALFCHAAAETVRANRAYRTYTFTIPMRPELKLGFPVFIPHKDMYAYIKTISLNYSVGGTATMTVSCDSVRRRVMVNTPQTIGTGSTLKQPSVYTSAPNLVLQWQKHPTAPTTPDPSQAPSNTSYWSQTYQLQSQGQTGAISADRSNPSSIIGVAQTQLTPNINPDGSKGGPTPAQRKVYSQKQNTVAVTMGNQQSSEAASYVVVNDGSSKFGTVAKAVVLNGITLFTPGANGGYFTDQRAANLAYMLTLCGDPNNHTNSVLPYTDNKGYEVVAPFPWGRWIDLNAAMKEFTEQGWIVQPTDANGNVTQNLNDLATLQNTDAFLFAGLGTPTGVNDPSSQLSAALVQQMSLVGSGPNIAQPAPNSATPSTPTQNSQAGAVITQPDFTVIVLHYDPSQPGSFAANSLLNAAQPENAFAEQLLSTTQNAGQKLVNVLVTGSVAPTPAVQEQLLATQTQNPASQNVALLNTITPNRQGQ